MNILDRPTPLDPQRHLDPRVQRTRKLLKDAMRELLLKGRISEITVQDITDHATVNRATFYAHFVDKEELAATILTEDMRELLGKRLGDRPKWNRENLVTFAIVVFEFIAALHRNCPITGAELQEKAGPTMHRGIAEFIEKWLQQDPSAMTHFPNCSRETVTSVISWSIYGRAQAWSTASNPDRVEIVCMELVSMLN